VLYPFYSDPEANLNGTPLEGAELINAEVSAKVSAKITNWASLDYVFSARYLPLIVDEWQVQNGLLVSAAFNLL
ncbi:MAG: hypothetical protein KC620_04775, partial [Myxococcales bacterium]|nr:hypothetical protein [Myxococcales bacterium]